MESIKDRKQFEVHSLPFLKTEDYFHSGYQQYAGELEIVKDVNYFFWLFTKDTPNRKLLIWLNGGPGCTSADGPLLERGILDIAETPKGNGYNLTVRPDGWHTFVDVLALDQPLGTGYSNGPTDKFVNNLDEAAYYFEKFLDKFLETFPEYHKREIYIGGESYAGVWIPKFADWMMKKRKDKINLKGLMIGNGWLDPKNQYASLVPFVESYELLNQDKMSEYKKLGIECIKAIKDQESNPVNNDQCESLLNSISRLSNLDSESSRTCLNLYDLRLRDQYPDCGMGWPPNVNAFRSYMADVRVSNALHTKQPKDGWTECNTKVGDALDGTKVESSVSLLPELLDQVQIMLFVGDKDIMVNWLGMEFTTGNLTWLGKQGFDGAKPISFGMNKEINDGVLTKRGSLVYARLYNGSHMVSYDLPSQTSNLFKWFINGANTHKKEHDNFYLENIQTTNRFTKGTQNNTTNAISNDDSGISFSPLYLGLITLFSLLVVFTLAMILFKLYGWGYFRKNKSDTQHLLRPEDDEVELSPTLEERNNN